MPSTPAHISRYLGRLVIGVCLLCLLSASQLRAQPTIQQTSQREADRISLVRALDAAQRSRNPAAEAEALYALALNARSFGRMKESLRRAEQAFALYETSKDSEGVAAASDLLGALQAQSGQFTAARTSFERALELRRASGDAAAEARSHHNLASLSLDAGDAARALERLDLALAAHRRQNDLEAEAAALNNLGLVWLRLGRYERARESLEQALALYSRKQALGAAADVRNNLGLLAFTERRWQDAARLFRLALEIRRQLGDVRGAAEALGNLGLVDIELGEFKSARRRLAGALELAQRHQLTRVEASHRGSLGRLELRQGRLDAAVSQLSSAADEQERLGNARGRSVSLLDLARAYRALGDADTAITSLEQAITILETLRGSLSSGEALAYALATERHYYDLLIDLLLEQNRRLDALDLSERARAQGLLQLLRLARPPAGDPTPFELTQLERHLDGETTVLAYHLGEHSAWAFSIVDDKVEAHSLGPTHEIEKLVETAYHHLSSSQRRTHRGAAHLAARALAARVLGPVEKKLRQRLIIVPDGGLHRIPFSVLSTSGGTPLIEEHQLSQVPSLSVLLTLKRSPRSPDPRFVAILADPVFDRADSRLAEAAAHGLPSAAANSGAFTRLKWSGVEAQRIAALFPTGSVELRLGLAANEDALHQGDLADFKRLHFATHAVIDDQHPERSGLALSPWSRAGQPRRGFLSLEDIFKLRLGAELVTLSACRSALGRSLRGEGLIGLSHGFFAAGARQVVVSLWDVDDRATSELMEHFYRSLAAGLAPSEALAKAQRRLRQDPRWRAAFYWAGFVLIGDWQ